MCMYVYVCVCLKFKATSVLINNIFTVHHNAEQYHDIFYYK